MTTIAESTTSTVDTANYFSVAAADDRENATASANATASGSSTPATGPVGEDKAARKARRIVEAVERSKREYVADNVYTERRWFLEHDDRGVSKTKIDQQRLEFLMSSLYYSNNPDHGEILSKVLGAFEQDKPGIFPRELLDIGIRSAIAVGDTASATRLARSGKPSWRTQWAGAACTAYDAFAAADDWEEALHPVISCMSIGGPQYPLLIRLRSYLDRHLTRPTQTNPDPHLNPESSSDQVELLRDKVEDVIRKRQGPALRPLFDEEASVGHERQIVRCPDRPSIDLSTLASQLGLEKGYVGVLEGAVGKLEKATRSADDTPAGAREERGVREL